MSIEDTKKQIAALPDGGRVFADAYPRPIILRKYQEADLNRPSAPEIVILCDRAVELKALADSHTALETKQAVLLEAARGVVRFQGLAGIPCIEALKAAIKQAESDTIEE